MIDLIDESGFIWDHKTTKRSYDSASCFENNLQMTAYQYVYRSKFKKDPAGLGLNVLARLKKAPKNQLLTITPMSEQQINRFVRTTKAVWDAINDKNTAWAPCWDPVKCSYCQYKTECNKLW